MRRPQTDPLSFIPSPTLKLQSGFNLIRFEFARNGAISGGCNCVRIDAIQTTQTDLDLDDMEDAWETDNGLNPADPSDGALDPDADGLVNAGEFAAGTSISNPDTDGDGVTDGEEVNTYNSDPLSSDGDADRMPDAYEISNGLNPADATDADRDADGDSFTNLQEWLFSSDPQDVSSVPVPMSAGGWTEGFESGAPPANWRVPEGYDGGFSVRDIVGDNSTYSLQSDLLPTRPAYQYAVIEMPYYGSAADLDFRYYQNSGPFTRSRCMSLT